MDIQAALAPKIDPVPITTMEVQMAVDTMIALACVVAPLVLYALAFGHQDFAQPQN
jgi:hypothetical protein